MNLCKTCVHRSGKECLVSAPAGSRLRQSLPVLDCGAFKEPSGNQTLHEAKPK